MKTDDLDEQEKVRWE